MAVSRADPLPVRSAFWEQLQQQRGEEERKMAEKEAERKERIESLAQLLQSMEAWRRETGLGSRGKSRRGNDRGQDPYDIFERRA